MRFLSLQVAEVMGKLGGRSRQWLLDGLSNEYKTIPEYGLRIILAFSPRTSFLVPLDRCVQFAANAIKQGARGARGAAPLHAWGWAPGGMAGRLSTAQPEPAISTCNVGL